MTKLLKESEDGRKEFVQSMAAIMQLDISACGHANIESRASRRAFGCHTQAKSIVDHFTIIDDFSKKHGVEMIGYYFFDDIEMRYIGPFETLPEALAAAGENIRQIEKKLFVPTTL